MMDKRPRKELIDGIRDFLKDFEEPYDRREWEHFQRHRKSRHRKSIPLFVKLAGIAASLFLMVYASVRFLPFFEGADEAGKNVPKIAPHPSKETEQQNLDTLTVDSITPAADHTNKEYPGAPMGLIRANRLPDSPWGRESDIPTAVAPGSSNLSRSDSAAIGRGINKALLPAISRIIMDLDGQKKPLRRKPNKSMRMDFPNLRPSVGNRTGFGDMRIGFNVNPAFTDKGFSFGGGLSAQIPVTRRISTEIGVNYTNITVGTDMEADMTDTLSLQTVGIRNSVGMVAIPVSLNYAVTESFTASLGLVPFRVVRDQRTDILQSNMWAAGGGLTADTTRRLAGERTRSRRADSLYMGNAYWGFVQVSGQFSPPFLKKHHAVIAPFVAIPIGRLRDDEYRWLHGGVSFRIYLR